MGKRLKRIGYIAYIACVAVGSYKFGWAGSLLCCSAWISACIYCDGKFKEDKNDA